MSALDPSLVASVCHDLRGPLGTIGTWLHVLASGRADEATRSRALEAMGRALREESVLIEQLSALAALPADERAAPGEPTLVAPLVRSALGAGGALSVDEGGATSTVRVEAERLRRLVAAFLGAVKGGHDERALTLAGAAGGTVLTLSAAGAPRPLSVALVERLAKPYGGRLEVESGSGRTTLVLRLPGA
jgi:signal transduction histidine kinase